ncbi:Hint domain-containing protein [Ruegeria sp. HKCCA5763]|uniref:Hint domain-containing protein n=1 Tax=Ruegeria sp. HKCCA5763 TaxID=2682987 RepID=UPI001488A354|nr:Hint domain-containing protein [Ruegeria sp. HKCCA5763]
MAEIYSVNTNTGEVFIRALPAEDVSGFFIGEYQQSGNGSGLVGLEPVATDMPYVAQPDDGFIYYRQVLGPLNSPSGQRDAIVLADSSGNPVDAVGWGKDSDFDLIGGPGDGIPINPGDGTYAPGDGPTYVDGPPWNTGPDPTDPPNGLVPLPPPCFGKGTLIETIDGPIPVEDLKPGQMICTNDGTKPVLWVGHAKVVFGRPELDHLRPIIFSPSSLGRNTPLRSLKLSPQHRICLQKPEYELLFGTNSVLLPAKFLVGRQGVTVDREIDSVDYYHILLDGHFILYSNGLMAESLLLSEWVYSESSAAALLEFREIFKENAGGKQNVTSRTCYPVLRKSEIPLLSIDVRRLH